jgi:hypothetical protein
MRVREERYVVDGKVKCSHCREWLPTEVFWRDSRAPCGYRAWCKPCDLKRMAGYYHEHRAELNEWQNNYAKMRRRTGNYFPSQLPKSLMAHDANQYQHRTENRDAS